MGICRGDADCHSQCAHWLRNDGSRKNLRVIPRPVRRLVVGIRNTPVQIQRGTDSHTSDIGHWFAMTVFCKKCGGAGRCGERTERCQWQKQRSERVAAVKILSVRRKAAQKFWAPQQGHRTLRISIAKRCVGDDAYIVPPPPHFLCHGIPLILFILSHFSKNARLPL